MIAKKVRHIIYFAVGAFIGAAVVTGVAFKQADEAEEPVEVKKDGRLQYKWYSPELPK